MSNTYRRGQGVEEAPMEGETLLYHAGEKKFCQLNETAAFLWSRLDQPRSVDEIARDMCESYEGVEFDQARADVQATVDELIRLSILEQA